MIVSLALAIVFFVRCSRKKDDEDKKRKKDKKASDDEIPPAVVTCVIIALAALFLWIAIRIHKQPGGEWFFELRWYSILFVSGFILGWFIFKWFFTREKLDVDLLDPLLYTLLFCTIVGARLGHCLFYQPDYYLGSWDGFKEIFMPWKGGLASHGGSIALIIGMWWFAKHYGKRKHFDFVWLLDHLAIAVTFAAFFIRLGNLCNSEIYGDVTSLPWGFIFELRDETEPKHPTQLYEGFTYLLLGLVLIGLYWKKLDKMYRGMFVGIFLMVCFGARFLIEFIKEPQVGFEETMALNMGQLLSIPFILLGIGFIVYAYKKKIPARAIIPEPVRTKK